MINLFLLLFDMAQSFKEGVVVGVAQFLGQPVSRYQAHCLALPAHVGGGAADPSNQDVATNTG